MRLFQIDEAFLINLICLNDESTGLIVEACLIDELQQNDVKIYNDEALSHRLGKPHRLGPLSSLRWASSIRPCQIDEACLNDEALGLIDEEYQIDEVPGLIVVTSNRLGGVKTI